MSMMDYLFNRIMGLPTEESGILIAAKEYQPDPINYSEDNSYDIHYKETDSFMFGAVSAKVDEDGLPDSIDFSKAAEELYENAKQ